MAETNNQVSNLRWAKLIIIKRLTSRFELAKLKYYKRDPLEKKVLDLAGEIYKEEEGSLFASFFTRREPVLFISPGELFNLWEQARIMADHGGAFAEVGVFRGASAKVICEAKGKTPLHLFDTFNGLPNEIGECDEWFKKGMFTASEKEVKERLSKYPNVNIHPGIFPETADAIKDLKFSFIHLDADLYSVTRKALEFFYPRMLPGGRILAHDYGQCESIWRAFDEFIIGKPEKLQPMELTQVMLIKS